MPLRAAFGDQQVFFDAERRKHAAALRHQAHAAAHGLERGFLRDVVALEHDFAAAWRIEADDRIHQRGLADAIASQKPKNLSLLKLQRQSLEHIGVPVIGVDVLHFENRHGVIPPRR